MIGWASKPQMEWPSFMMDGVDQRVEAPIPLMWEKIRGLSYPTPTLKMSEVRNEPIRIKEMHSIT
jgi:hypothetical protein